MFNFVELNAKNICDEVTIGTIFVRIGMSFLVASQRHSLCFKWFFTCGTHSVFIGNFPEVSCASSVLDIYYGIKAMLSKFFHTFGHWYFH